MFSLKKEEFSTKEEICKNTVKVFGIKNDTIMSLPVASILEITSNRFIELINDPEKKDEYEQGVNNFSKKSEFKVSFPELAITDKYLSTAIYSRFALGYSTAINITQVINEEGYKRLMTKEEERNKIINTGVSNLSPVISFINDKTEFSDLFLLVDSLGNKTNEKDSEDKGKTLSGSVQLSSVGEINLAGEFKMYDLQSIVTFSAITLKALENTYCLNLMAGISLSGVYKRS